MKKHPQFSKLSPQSFSNIANSRLNAIIILWLTYNRGANIIAQDCRPCDDNSQIELFKYFTKIITKVGGQYKFFPEQFDHIFSTLYKKRTFRTYGLTKQLSEDIEDIQAVEIEELESKYGIYSFEGWDWYNVETGEALTDYKPPDALLQLTDSIKKVDCAPADDNFLNTNSINNNINNPF